MQTIKFSWLTKISVLLFTLALTSCGNEPTKKETEIVKKDTLKIEPKDTVVEVKETLPQLNDSLNELANFISGNKNYKFKVFTNFTDKKPFQNFSADFSKRWINFDSTRLYVIKNFAETTLSKELTQSEHLFYPFSGPDIFVCLYPIPKHKTLHINWFRACGNLTNCR